MTDPSSSESAQLTEAGALIAAGRYDKALKLLAGLTAPGRHRLAGAALLGRRHADAARDSFRLAIIDDPGHVGDLLGTARAHLAKLEIVAAIALLEALARRAPGLGGLTETTASAYRRDARYEDAIALIDASAPTAALRYERALSLLQLGRSAESLAEFDNLLAEAPDHAAAWFWSHAPALDLLGWPEAERRVLAATLCPRASRKYLAFLSAYDLLHKVSPPRPCPIPYRHQADAAGALSPFLAADCRLFGVPAALLRWGLGSARNSGLIAEFGVRRGNSIRILGAETEDPVHGFDSFEGLPEAWVKAPAGVLTTGGSLPRVPANVVLHPGWFEDSLPSFLAAHPDGLRFANIDSDIYSSAKTILRAFADRIESGTILVFDEMVGNRSWRQDEFRAWSEFVAERDLRWQAIAVNLSGKQVAIRIG